MKLTYDYIKLNDKVKNEMVSSTSPNYIGEIVCIENWCGYEPVFTVQYRDLRNHYGLKYILKNLQ